MSLSSDITRILMEMLADSGSTEIRRNDLAQNLGCVPSQINYVIASRFTPEQGYIVESRRGGGGYIKITRVSCDNGNTIMHAVNSVGDSIDPMSVRAFVSNLTQQGLLGREAAALMLAALSDSALRPVPPEFRDNVRASVFKQMLLTVHNL